MTFNDELVAVLPRLRRFARGLTRNAVDADDLVQAACVRALACKHQFQKGTRFDSWMFRIVQTIWIDKLRARTLHGEDQWDDQHEQLGTDKPAREQEACADLEKAWWAINQLPPDQRMVMRLVVIEGLSYREAAAIAGVPVGTIMSRLARARNTVRWIANGARGDPPLHGIAAIASRVHQHRAAEFFRHVFST